MGKKTIVMATFTEDEINECRKDHEKFLREKYKGGVLRHRMQCLRYYDFLIDYKNLGTVRQVQEKYEYRNYTNVSSALRVAAQRVETYLKNKERGLDEF